MLHTLLENPHGYGFDFTLELLIGMSKSAVKYKHRPVVITEQIRCYHTRELGLHRNVVCYSLQTHPLFRPAVKQRCMQKTYIQRLQVASKPFHLLGLAP